MVSKKEVIAIVISVAFMTLILTFTNNIIDTIYLPKYLLFSLVIILIAVLSKKIVARIIDLRAEMDFFKMQRYWFYRNSYFKKPIPIGLILPLLLSFLSMGKLKLLTFLQFDLIKTPARVAKKYGTHRFSDINDWDFALVSFYSLVSLLLLAIISLFFLNQFSFSKELAKFTLLYAGLNLIPFGQLDGSKLFYGSRPLYIFSLILFFVVWGLYFL